MYPLAIASDMNIVTIHASRTVSNTRKHKDRLCKSIIFMDYTLAMLGISTRFDSQLRLLPDTKHTITIGTIISANIVKMASLSDVRICTDTLLPQRHC